MTKTYKCPVHGEFEHECKINDKELTECPQIWNFQSCDEPVTRVFKPVGYSWKCEGFAGRGFDTVK